MPAVVVSHIMLEAYKKYVLIWLIYHGDKTQDALTFPKYTSPVVSKYIKPLCAPYHEVIKAFYSRYVLIWSHPQMTSTQKGEGGGKKSSKGSVTN